MYKNYYLKYKSDYSKLTGGSSSHDDNSICKYVDYNDTIIPFPKNIQFNIKDSIDLAVRDSFNGDNTEIKNILNEIKRIKAINDPRYRYYKYFDDSTHINIQKLYSENLLNEPTQNFNYTSYDSNGLLREFCKNSIDTKGFPNIPKDEKCIRLLTYNVHSFAAPCLNWSGSKIESSKDIEVTDETIELLKRIDPDIICLQEFAANKVYTPIPIGYNIDYFMKNFNPYYKCNYSLLDNYKNDFPFKPGVWLFNLTASLHLDSKYNQCVTLPSGRNINVTQHNFMGMDIIIYNIHPMPDDWYKNKRKDRLIMNDFSYISSLFAPNDTYNKNILICGDFNCYHKDEFYYHSIGGGGERFSNPHQFLLDKEFINLWEFVDYDEHDFSGQHLTLIDYIYASKAFITYFQIVKLQILNVYLSDHFPLLFEFKLRNQNIIREAIRYKVEIHKNKNNFDNIFKYMDVDLNNFTSKFDALKHIYIDINAFIKENGLSVEEIPEDTLYCHRTPAYSHSKDEIGKTVPFELWDQKNWDEGKYGHVIVKEDSTVSLNYISESFTQTYGKISPILPTRKIIYKAFRLFKMIKLINDKLSRNNMNIRLEFYRKFIKFIIKTNYKLNLNLNINTINNWHLQDIIQLLWTISLLKHNFDSTHIPVGIIIIDVFKDEIVDDNLNTRFINATYYWNRTLSEGVEFQLIGRPIYAKIHGIIHNNEFINYNDYKKQYLEIYNNLTVTKNNDTFYKKYSNFTGDSNLMNLQSLYNIKLLKFLTLKEILNHLYLVNKINNTNNYWFKSVINYRSELNKLYESYDKSNRFILNININYFILVLLKIYNNDKTDIYKDSSGINTLDDIDNISYDTSDSKTNTEFYNILELLNKYNELLFHKYGINDDNNYINEIVKYSLTLIPHIPVFGLNIPLLTIFKNLFSSNSTVKNLFSDEYRNKILKDYKIQ